MRGVFAAVLAGAGQDRTRTPALGELRGQVIYALAEAAFAVYLDDEPAILAGQRTTDLKAGFPARLQQPLVEIKRLYAEIFAHPAKVAAELGAYKALGRIAHSMAEACWNLTEAGGLDAAGFLSRRTLELTVGADHARLHERAGFEFWLHQVMDHVAGLTDNAARRLSRDLEGV